MHHSKYSYVKKILEANMPVLLCGEAGSGKSTLIMQIAEELSTGFHSISCTKQMSVSALVGFISITGTYIPTQLRQAYENGGVFLLDEMDAADPNVLLTLNTIENGFISFPDKIVHAHSDFRLCATANPFHSHSTYTGRSKLDFSTIDRYFVIELERDPSLEIALTSQELYDKVSLARSIMEANGVSTPITMRDSIRMHKLDSLDITDCVFKDIAFKDHASLHTEFVVSIAAKEITKAKQSATQSDATTIDDLWDIVQRESQSSKATVDTGNRLTYDDLMNAAKRLQTQGMPVPDSYTTTHTENEYDSDVQAERTQAFDVAQNVISRGSSYTPDDWSITKRHSAENPYEDEYIVKGPRFTHKFLSSEFIPF